MNDTHATDYADDTNHVIIIISSSSSINVKFDIDTDNDNNTPPTRAHAANRRRASLGRAPVPPEAALVRAQMVRALISAVLMS